MAGRAKHEKLARLVEFCVMVCHHGLWYFTGHFVGQWNAAEVSAKSLFPVPRLFHDKKNSSQKGGIQSESAFPGDPSSARETANMTSPLQENWHRVRSRASNGLSFHSRLESRPYVYIICDDGSSWPFKKWNYPPVTLSNPST